jgi:hypothetical protein
VSELSPLRRIAFAAIPSILCALGLSAVYVFVMSDEQAEGIQRGAVHDVCRHFGDAGHRILGDRMVVAISAILGGSEPEPGSEPSRAAAVFVD